jgi:hypothetical protein
MHRCPHLLLLAALLPGSLTAQSLTQRVNAVEDGTVRLSFAARQGTCGNGASGISVRQISDEWQPDCDPRLVRVALRMSKHRIYSIRTYVGGHWLPDTTATDLGTVRPQEAASYFIGVAGQTGDGLVNDDPFLPAVLADSVIIWPSLLRLARTPTLSKDTRTKAVFWLSQAAGVAAANALDSIAHDDRGDREVRRQAIFALSQRSPDEGVPALIRIARASPDPELRKTALFWLGQSEDPRALELFEEILR